MISDSRDLGRCVKGGIVAGIVAGALLAIVMLVLNLINGHGVWAGMKFAGAPFLGARAMEPGFDFIAVLVGLLSHFAVSIAWGIPFALVALDLSRSETILAGAFAGIVVWLGMFYVVMPLVGLGEAARNTPVMIAMLEHILFGAALGFGLLPFQRPVPTPRPFAPAR